MFLCFALLCIFIGCYGCGKLANSPEEVLVAELPQSLCNVAKNISGVNFETY